MEPTTIYGPADVAKGLGVTRAAVTNWLARYDDWPEPNFMTPDGRMFWTDLDLWQAWHAVHLMRSPGALDAWMRGVA